MHGLRITVRDRQNILHPNNEFCLVCRQTISWMINYQATR